MYEKFNFMKFYQEQMETLDKVHISPFATREQMQKVDKQKERLVYALKIYGMFIEGKGHSAGLIMAVNFEAIVEKFPDVDYNTEVVVMSSPQPKIMFALPKRTNFRGPITEWIPQTEYETETVNMSKFALKRSDTGQIFEIIVGYGPKSKKLVIAEIS